MGFSHAYGEPMEEKEESGSRERQVEAQVAPQETAKADPSAPSQA